MTLLKKTIEIETPRNKIKLETGEYGKMTVAVEERATEDNNYEVGNKATLYLNSSDLEDLYEALGLFRD